MESFDGHPVTVSVGAVVTTLEESSVTIQCASSGFPKPAVVWLKDGQPVGEAEGVVAHSNGSLTIAKALASHSGTYTCVSSNGFGEDRADSTVTVVGA